jgi:uncharacterized membrane protein
MKLHKPSFPKVIKVSMSIFLISLVTLPFLAPILVHFGYRKPANVIYKIYSFFCHQKAHRSMFIYDEQCAWCVRDTFIWTTLLFIWIFVMRSGFVKELRLKVAILLAAPMILDGGIQLLATIYSMYSHSTPFYESTNLLRAITGTMFGLAVGMYLFPRLKKELDLYRS